MKPETLTKGAATPPQPNAWLIKIAGQTEPFSVTIPAAPALVKGVVEGDAVAMLAEGEGKTVAVLFARIYRVRSRLEATTLYFDAVLAVEPPREATSLGLPVPTGIVGRVDWPTYTAALKAATGKEFKELLPFEGKIPAEQNYLRRLLQLAVMDDLHGPANGPEEEVIGMSVRDRYLVGKLAPKTVGPASAQASSPLDGIESVATKEKPPRPAPCSAPRSL